MNKNQEFFNKISSKKGRTWLIGVVVVLGVALVLLYNAKSLPLPGLSEIFYESHEVRKIQVLQGHEFDVLLVDGKRIHAYLKIKTPPEARDRVIVFINHSTCPKMIMYKQEQNGWIVDLTFSEGSLTDWLVREGLVWE